MTRAKQGDKVQVHYKGRLKDGTEFDSSEGGDPMEFIIGESRIIPAFEQAVVGMEPGEQKTQVIAAQEAYGETRPDLVFEVERDKFPDSIQPEVGLQLKMTQPDGKAIPVRVHDVTDEKVALDANHPLAGRELTFVISLVAIV